jgi:cyclopropane-fatty-acyl-phospholipid synthase
METRVAEWYFSSPLRIPGFLQQALLSAYIVAYHGLETLAGRRPSSPVPEDAAIAEHSGELMRMHYDMPRPMFEHMLGATMKYSAGLWEAGARTLEDAQEAMLADIVAKLGLRDGERVLDIGCGFGSFAAHVLRRFPRVRVHGLTLSRVQADYLREKQRTAGNPLCSDRFTVIEADFNTVQLGETFDRVVSIGVFEHVTNLGAALAKIRTFLASGGYCLLHYIVFRRLVHRPGLSVRQDAFMDRYIFPGGRIWFEDELAGHLGPFVQERFWFLNGMNYKRTLEAWLDNLLRHLGAIQAEAGLSARQLRIWEVYLRACIGLFALRGGRAYGNGQYLLRPV